MCKGCDFQSLGEEGFSDAWAAAVGVSYISGSRVLAGAALLLVCRTISKH